MTRRREGRKRRVYTGRTPAWETRSADKQLSAVLGHDELRSHVLLPSLSLPRPPSPHSSAPPKRPVLRTKPLTIRGKIHKRFPEGMAQAEGSAAGEELDATTTDRTVQKLRAGPNKQPRKRTQNADGSNGHILGKRRKPNRN